MFAAVLSAFGYAADVLSGKLLLSERSLNFRNYLSICMVFVFLVTLIPFYFLGAVSPEAFSFGYMAAFAGVLVCAFFYNSFYFYALSKENACEVEPIALLAQPITIIMAALIFPSERSFYPIVFTIIAASALVLSRVKKHHLKMNKYTMAMLGFVFLLSIESQLVKVLLEVFSPVALYTLRTGILATLFVVFLNPNLKRVSKTQYAKIFLVAVVTMVELIARFYAIQSLGIVMSSLVFLLGPVIVLLTSTIFFKEKITFKKALGDIVIVLCVAAVYLFR